MKNVLIISGYNNHDWKRTTPFFGKVLEETGEFAVKYSYEPSEDLAKPETLEGIDVIMLDYNGPMWCEEAKKAFVKAIEGGVGMVAIHAANNWTKGFDELETMLGVVWTAQSSHGYFHEFDIEVQAPDHPFAKGLSNFKNWDELYHCLENTQNAEFTVIADAFSATEQRGSGKREPMIIVNKYGKGHIVHNILGHVWPTQTEPKGHTSMMAVDNPDYRALLIRCCKYAAYGEV